MRIANDGDFNGHAGRPFGIFNSVRIGHSFVSRNDGGTSLLEFCDANKRLIGTTNFRKQTGHLITYQPGNLVSQIDYILNRLSLSRRIL